MTVKIISNKCYVWELLEFIWICLNVLEFAQSCFKCWSSSSVIHNTLCFTANRATWSFPIHFQIAFMKSWLFWQLLRFGAMTLAALEIIHFWIFIRKTVFNFFQFHSIFIDIFRQISRRFKKFSIKNSSCLKRLPFDFTS